MTETPSPGYGPPSGYGQPPAYGPPQEDTVWPVLAHLSAFVFPIIPPLVLFLIHRNDPAKPLTRYHSSEALNFHLTLALFWLVGFASFFVGMFISSWGFLAVSSLLMVAVYIAAIVCTILAAIAAGKRQLYRYPLTIRFVR